MLEKDMTESRSINHNTLQMLNKILILVNYLFSILFVYTC